MINLWFKFQNEGIDRRQVKIKDLPEHKRPREKLGQLGAENLSDKELLAILLRTGIKGKNALELASKILNKHPIKDLLSLKLDELTEIKGINNTKAITLLAAFELAKRVLDKFDNNLPIINSPQKALDQLTELTAHKQEHFVVLYLNARNQLVKKVTISKGTVNSSIVHPREVFLPAIKYLATSIILAHNHPSGDSGQSDEDMEITNRLVHAGQILGIEVIDHLIITKSDFLSFKDKGLI
jgi:DNA repair protein RadC